MDTGQSGKVYENGEVIIRQGDVGDCMYVIDEGDVEVLQEKDGNQIVLAVLGKGDVFGEMALFRKEVRSSMVRALGRMRVSAIDKRDFLRRVHEDPSFAFMILQKMSRRVKELNAEMVRLKIEL